MYGYEWTKEYGIFRLTIEANLQKEIRPVFHEELDFFGMDQYWDYPKDTDAPLLWAEGIRQYVLNGACVAVAEGGGFYEKPRVVLKTSERLQLKPVDVDRLYEVNKNLLLSLEHKAIGFIREQYEKYVQSGYSFICAFSGGKDSLVLLDLVAKALAPRDFYVVFSNTGMELSDTLKAVERAKARWHNLRFEEAKCHMNPCDSWDEFGPPAQRMRWCCTVHKSAPTILKLRELTQDYNAHAVVFDGVRAEESARRAKYDEVGIGAKNICQINCHAILKWNAAEVYCYLLYRRILFNDAYRVGLFRVGCKVCPMGAGWWEGITNIQYKEEVKPLFEKIERYAERNKHLEAKTYIEGGGWKARMGGKCLDNGGNRVKERIVGNRLTFTIEKSRQPWAEVAKLLGAFVGEGGGKRAQKIGGRLYDCAVAEEDGRMTVSYAPFSLMDRFVISHLRGVASKVAYCVGCKACEVQCPTGAFTIQPDGKILIREDKCVHCFNCIQFVEKGCLVADSLRFPEGGFMNMKRLDLYHRFGFRQAWLEHFFEYGLDCFGKGVLGTGQYSALKSWLQDAGMIETVKKGKTSTLAITPLGEKLKKFGSYHPFTWAVIWTNLCYNSAVCRWYCLNAEIGATYERADLVTMLGEDYAKSTRENGVSSLTETLRLSPIGAALGQGLPLELSKNSYSYLREGWEVPDAAALLYALYVYGEHTGRKTFTFSELANAHAVPEANGVSPHDIFGIDAKSFREKIQGLAMTYPDYIRVSFIANLDNIILEHYSSTDIIDLASEE